MQMFYSATTNGFYCVEVNGAGIPADAKEISDELYAQCSGRHVVPDANGLPCLKTPSAPNFEQRKEALLASVDEHLNAAARAKGYDSILSASLRAALPSSPFHDEGVAFGTWMDAVYAKCYAVLADVIAGQMSEPDKEQLLALLPPLNLPVSKGA